MLSTTAVRSHEAPPPQPALPREAGEHSRQRIAQTLQLLHDSVPIQRRVLHAGEVVYQGGTAFTTLYVINSGFFKTVNLASDGREQMVGLHMRGDWIGFEGIAGGRYGCDAIAMDTGEVWAIRYEALLKACAEKASLLSVMHAAMSREIAKDRDSMLSLCTLPADARVADFLRGWTEALAERGLRTDQITLRMTRAEIGNYLGMTLESVSRALSRMARSNVIRFGDKGRREIGIPSVEALVAYVQSSLLPAGARLQ
jgi:CRP/FNR family transcriptional regulator, anaerobic regulatory protein